MSGKRSMAAFSASVTLIGGVHLQQVVALGELARAHTRLGASVEAISGMPSYG